jgi:hypothetical protein
MTEMMGLVRQGMTDQRGEQVQRGEESSPVCAPLLCMQYNFISTIHTAIHTTLTLFLSLLLFALMSYEL